MSYFKSVQLDELISEEMKSIEDADRQAGGIEDVAQLTVYLTSLAHAAYGLGQSNARAWCAEAASGRAVALRELEAKKNPQYTEDRLMRAGLKLAADTCDEIAAEIRKGSA